MLRASRRTTLKLLGGAGLAATLPLPLAAQGDDLVVPNTYQNFKRGTIHSLHPERRIFNIVWEDLGRVKMMMSKPPALVETLKYTIADKGKGQGELRLEWEHHVATVPIAVK